MVNNSVKNEIYNLLNYDIFRREDFDISSVYGEVERVFHIHISYEENYFYLKFFIDKRYCMTKYSPGDIFIESEGRIDLDHFGMHLAEKLHSWMDRLKDELVSPIEQRFINKDLQNFKKQLYDRLDGVENSFFSREEGEELKKRLELLADIIQNKADLSEESEAEIKKMREEIEFLKATVDTLTKKKWIKNALVKIWAWGQKPENQKLIESGISTVKAISQMDIPDMKR